MKQHIDLFVLFDLKKAGRQAGGLGVHVELAEAGGLALYRHADGARGEVFQLLHILGREELALVGPAFGAGGSADAHKTPALLQDFDALAMFDGGHNRRLEGDFAANLENRGANESFANRRRVLALIGARSQHHAQTNYRYETSEHTLYYFINRVSGESLYNELMTLETKRPFILFGGFAVLFVAFVTLLIRVLPGPRTPFDYMVAGTFATALALVVMFVVVASRRR